MRAVRSCCLVLLFAQGAAPAFATIPAGGPVPGFLAALTREERTAVALDFPGSIALSADGRTALAGAPLAVCDHGYRCGAAYVLVRNRGFWTRQAILTASDRSDGEQFGNQVALSADGNTALVGSFLAGCAPGLCGAAYVFVRERGTWTQQAKLTASDGASFDYMGLYVALSADGDTALASADGADCLTGPDCGAVYVFTRNQGTWTQQAKLTALHPAAGDHFGLRVSLSSGGQTALARGVQGAHAFTRGPGGWTEEGRPRISSFGVKQGVVEIPTISGLGLAILSVLLALCAALRLRLRV